MEHIRRAIEVTEKMRQQLAAEVTRARGQRDLVRQLDGEGVANQARLRSDFNLALAQLEQELARHLGAAAAEWSLPEVTMDRLRAHAPAEAARLADRLAEVRRLVAELRELDALNRILLQRALACVRGYLNTLTPQPTAYDRRGAATTAAVSTASRVV